MTTQTEPQDRSEIRTMEDLLAAVRMGLEIATRSDIADSERRVIERISEQFNARFDAQDTRIADQFAAQNRWIADQFAAQNRRIDAQDRRQDAQDARQDAQDAQLNEIMAAIRESNASKEADRRSKARTIQWLSLAVGALGALATATALALAFLGG